MEKVYITKYALTSGIKEIQCEVRNVNGQLYAIYKGFAFIPIGKDAFFSRENAINKVEKMKNAKIASLKKQLDKLEQLKFGQDE